jgi:hypothetical protein
MASLIRYHHASKTGLEAIVTTAFNTVPKADDRRDDTDASPAARLMLGGVRKTFGPPLTA